MLNVNELCTVESWLHLWVVSGFDFSSLSTLVIYLWINFEFFHHYGEDEQLTS